MSPKPKGPPTVRPAVPRCLVCTSVLPMQYCGQPASRCHPDTGRECRLYANRYQGMLRHRATILANVSSANRDAALYSLRGDLTTARDELSVAEVPRGT